MALGDVGGVGSHSLIADRELFVLQQLKDAVFERVTDERRHLVQPLRAKLNKRHAPARALWPNRAIRQARARAARMDGKYIEQIVDRNKFVHMVVFDRKICLPKYNVLNEDRKLQCTTYHLTSGIS